MSLVYVGACAAGGQGPAFMGPLFLWGGCDKEGDILAASRGLSDMKLGATQSPGGGGLRQGVLRKELTWQVGGTAGRPACLRSDQGNGRELVSEQWVANPEVEWKSWIVQIRGGMSSDVEVKRFL